MTCRVADSNEDYTGSATYAFTIGRRAAAVKADFVKKGFFADVPADSFYYEAVKWAVEKGITNGTDATHFSPNEPCTRAQIVTFLWRYEGKPAPSSTRNPFADVNTGSYYGSAVLWAVEHGITNGMSATEFCPENTCTRAQVVTFLYRDIVNQ